METKFGLMLDSVFDRIAEAAVIVGALFSGIIESIELFAIAGSVCLLMFCPLSYRKGLRSDYVVFWRTERLIFILAGLVVPFCDCKQSLLCRCRCLGNVFVSSNCRLFMVLSTKTSGPIWTRKRVVLRFDTFLLHDHFHRGSQGIAARLTGFNRGVGFDSGEFLL